MDHGIAAQIEGNIIGGNLHLHVTLNQGPVLLNNRFRPENIGVQHHIPVRHGEGVGIAPADLFTLNAAPAVKLVLRVGCRRQAHLCAHGIAAGALHGAVFSDNGDAISVYGKVHLIDSAVLRRTPSHGQLNNSAFPLQITQNSLAPALPPAGKRADQLTADSFDQLRIAHRRGVLDRAGPPAVHVDRSPGDTGTGLPKSLGKALYKFGNSPAGLVNMDKSPPFGIFNIRYAGLLQLKHIQSLQDTGFQFGKHCFPRGIDLDLPYTLGDRLAGCLIHQLEGDRVIARTAEAKGPLRAAGIIRRQVKRSEEAFIFKAVFALAIHGFEGYIAGTLSAESDVGRIITRSPLLIGIKINSYIFIFFRQDGSCRKFISKVVC